VGHVKSRLHLGADQKIATPEQGETSSPTWLADAEIEAFMASIEAPDAALVG